jgi:hypothetical protein
VALDELLATRTLIPFGANWAATWPELIYSLRVFGQVGSTGRVLESLNSGPNA